MYTNNTKTSANGQQYLEDDADDLLHPLSVSDWLKEAIEEKLAAAKEWKMFFMHHRAKMILALVEEVKSTSVAVVWRHHL